MKRGLSITLGTIAMAFMANTGFANAPVFTRIPDVIIGDLDDNQHGLTVDVNFFRYDNAFNILDFITDETTSLLRFSFVEGTTHQNVSINGAHNLDSQGLNPNSDHPAWRTDANVEITGGGTNYWFSFRDLLRSPDDRAIPDPVGSPLTLTDALNNRFPDPVDLSSNPVIGFPPAALNVQPLPWQNIAASNTLGTDNVPAGESAYKRMVLLYGSDATTVSWQSFYVWSVNDVYDTLSGGLTTIFSDDFTGTVLDWYSFNAAPAIPAATAGSGSGYVSLTAPSTGTSFGGWATKTVPDPVYGLQIVGPIGNIDTDEIYVAHYEVRHNAPDRGSAPVLRLRAQMPNEIMYYQWYFRAYPGGVDDVAINPAIPDPNTDKTYNLYWSPNGVAPNFDNMIIDVAGTIYDTRSYILAFDIIDESDTQQGTWTLKYVEVGAADRPPTETTGLTLSNLTTTGPNWTSAFVNPANNSMTLTNNSPATGMITFNDPGVDLTPPGDDPPNWLIELYASVRDWSDTVYRVTTRLSYPTQADRDNAHRFRVRHNTTIDQVQFEFWLNQNLKGQGNPALPVVANGAGSVYTPYELYVNGFGGASSLLTTLAFNKWGLALDQLCNSLSGGQEELATKTSVHAVLYESLGPLGL